MRNTFINTLIELAKTDKRIFLLTGDLGFSVLEKFQQKFPERFFNMGVAEQNMIGVAAGLALSGKIVFVYSIVPFITMRCFEQIRNDLCFQNLNVHLIGIGGGVSYGCAGATHFALEDVSVMRSLANMTVITPGNYTETKASIEFSMKHQGPIYIRLGKEKVSITPTKENFQIDRGIVLEKGKDITIIATGSILELAKMVCIELKKRNLSVNLISMPMIKPLDEKIVLESAQKTKAIFTIENHGFIGGLGSAVSEVISESQYKILFRKFALSDKVNTFIGSQEYLFKKSGMTVSKITREILKIYFEKKKII